ncbi:methylase [Streptomyces fodineus]|uniref:peptide chain release factor N(5)-glutamine methyltransferase n=1 Tax=Streptomyces fodineus TaxID=1904616 RepID=A0A1D7YNW2_9ACTN|nr:methylase [Streptomyces fodineus]
MEPVVARLRAAGCVFAEEEAELILDAAGRSTGPGSGEERAADVEVLVDRMVARRCAGEPLEHVVGWAAFCGLRIAVTPGVFVPRRRTEFLVAQAMRVGRDAALIVDLCCGAAPLATALAVRLPRAEIHAADIDPVQTASARRNLELFANRAHVHEGDLYAALPQALRGRVDLLVANAPYVPVDALATLPAEAREHEPVHSLAGGRDGLEIQRRIAAGADGWLAPGGHVIVETGEDQAPHTRALFAGAGLDAWVAECEEMEATVVVGRRPRSARSGPAACRMARSTCSCPE